MVKKYYNYDDPFKVKQSKNSLTYWNSPAGVKRKKVMTATPLLVKTKKVISTSMLTYYKTPEGAARKLAMKGRVSPNKGHKVSEEKKLRIKLKREAREYNKKYPNVGGRPGVLLTKTEERLLGKSDTSTDTRIDCGKL